MFTPSILTILGVIMYLRLPWIVGNGGLWLSLGIILAAHLIAWTTGLSVSSIATDKRVAAGGAYYIVSRTMGLSMGGTLGIALFVGLSFSISLYVIGFSESFLPYVGLDKDIATIRICGTVTVILLTIITFISTSLAIRTQYLILALIAGSLVSIAAGSSEFVPETPNFMPYETGAAATTLFGIFFPAVTGFTAGVNMSGDLKDPRRAIPVGTVASIGVGMTVYVALAIFFSYRIDQTQLVTNDTILLEFAWSSNAVVFGIWGATLSSALGSILGAPRILQALSLDRITPRVFGIGHGPTNEPRYALGLAFVIGEAGILIGELDAIARIVSVFFIATYGFLNLSASFEMIASPDFRPSFKIPRVVPVIGALTCSILMIWLDLVAMLGAVVVMSLLFVVLKRRELQLETGDALLGVWSSVVRSGLDRLDAEAIHERNWLPNILLFTEPDAPAAPPMRFFGHSIVRHRGVATEFELVIGGAGPEPAAFQPLEPLEVDGEAADVDGAESDDVDVRDQVGFFARQVPVAPDALYDTMGNVCQFHGFSGLEPNTVMVDWHTHAQHPEDFSAFLHRVVSLDLNVLALAFDPAKGLGETKHIDLWWTVHAGSLPLYVALVRFITAAEEWRRAELRFFVICDDSSMVDALYKTTAATLAGTRIEGTVKVIDNALERRPHAEWVKQYSLTTDMTVLGIPHDDLRPRDIVELDELAREIGAVMLLRASSQFGSGFTTTSASTLMREPTEDVDPQRIRVPSLRVPETPDLANQALAFAEPHMALAEAFADRCLRGEFVSRAALLELLQDEIDLSYRELEAAVAGAGKRRRDRTISRAPVTLMRRLQDTLSEFERGELSRQQATAERGVEDFLDGVEALKHAMPTRVRVTRGAQDFQPDDDDEGPVRRYKTRRRLTARLLRRPVKYTLRPWRLVHYWLDHETLHQTDQALRRVANHTMLVAEDLGRVINTVKASLGDVQRRYREGELTADHLQAERHRLATQLSEIRTEHLAAGERQLAQYRLSARQLQQSFADDLDRIHPGRHARRERKFPRASRDLPQQLRDAPPRGAEIQAVLLQRTMLAPLVASVQTRLTSAMHEATSTLTRAVDEGMRQPLETLKTRLERFREQVNAGEAPGDLTLEVVRPEAFDEGPVVEHLHQALQSATATVPESVRLPIEEGLQALATDPFAELEAKEVDLRRHLQVLVDGELVGPIQEILGDLPRAEQSAASVAEDVVRLISFHVTDLDAGDADHYGEILAPVIDNGVERIETELARADELGSSLRLRMLQRLEHVVDLTDQIAILGTAEAVQAHGRRSGAGAVSGLGRLASIASQRLRSALVTLAYRRSAGVLLARSIEDDGATARPAADEILALVDTARPTPAMVDALPFYYVQLFLGQSAMHSAFWVGREAELQRIEGAIDRTDRGFHGALMVVGAPGSGKTALVEVATERFLSDRAVYRILPPQGGSCDPKQFRQTLQQELRRWGRPHDLMESLPDRSVLVLYDVEAWWERSPEGTRVVELIVDLVETYGDRILFVLEVGRSAMRMMEYFSPVASEALAVVETGPVDAESLKDIVIQRHNSTGLGFRIEGRGDEAPSELQLAQLFSAHFQVTDGNIGAALASWIAHIDRIEDGILTVRSPRQRSEDALGGLPVSQLALLVQLVLHRELTVERLARITELPELSLRRDLAALRRMGLLSPDRRDVVELDPAARHLVHRFLTGRGMLP